MKRNIRIARELVRLAKMLVAGSESFGRYSIDSDKKKRTITVYFILDDGAVESDAENDAKACRDEIERILGVEDVADVTSLRNNDHKSFCFDIMLEEPEKTAGAESKRVLVAVGEEEGDSNEGGDSDGGSDEGDSGDLGDSDSESEGDSKNKSSETDEESNPEDEKAFKEIEEKIKAVFKKHAWDAGK